MRWKNNLPGLTAISVLGAAAVSSLSGGEPTRVSATPPPEIADSVVQSFARELQHTPGPIAEIRRESIDDDELYQALNTIHWTPEMQANSDSTNNEPTGNHQEKDQ